MPIEYTPEKEKCWCSLLILGLWLFLVISIGTLSYLLWSQDAKFNKMVKVQSDLMDVIESLIDRQIHEVR